MRSKKAQAFKILNYGFWRFLFISLVFFVIYWLAATHIQSNLDVYDLRATIFSHEALNSFSHVGEYSNIPSPGLIDESKYSTSRLSSIFDNTSTSFGASFILDDLDNSSQKEIFYNKKWFDRYYPLSKYKDYHRNLRWRYALIKNDTTKKARLLIKTIENG